MGQIYFKPKFYFVNNTTNSDDYYELDYPTGPNIDYLPLK